MKQATQVLKKLVVGSEYEDAVKAEETIKALEEALKQEQDEPWLLNYAKNLAKFMAKNFYPEVTHWKVSDDLVGVILQIDNMVTGLIRKSKQEQGEPVTTDWERIARVQNAKLMAMSDTVGGFEKLCEVLDKYETTKPQTKEWVKLTREEKYSIYIECSNCFIREPTWEDFANAVEDKLKELNK